MITTVNLHGIRAVVIGEPQDPKCIGRPWQEIDFMCEDGSKFTAVVFFSRDATPLPVTARPVEAQHETV
jgi:hypothetical protein